MKKFNLKKFKSEAKGFTLIELLIAIAFIAVASALLYVAYNKVKETGDANAEGRNLDLIRAGVKNLYASNNSYTGIGNLILNQARVTPESMRSTEVNAVISNKFGGTVEVAAAQLGGGAAGNAFSILYTGVPAAVCVKLVTTAGNQFEQVVVDSTPVKNFGSQLDAAAAAGACSDAGANGIDITFTSL